MDPTVPFPSFSRRAIDFELPLATTRDKIRRLFSFLLAADKVKGVDLAPDYQRGEILDVRAMQEAGYKFAFVQVNRGLWAHPNLMEFCAPLFAAGMPIMTYALFYGTLSGEDQAHFHLEHAYPIWRRQGWKLPAMLDIEVRDGVTPAVRITRSEDWFRVVRTEVYPVKYCSPSLNTELLNGYPLGETIGHVAHWTSAIEPVIPVGWTREKTRFWQYGVATKNPWCPPVPGMAADVDVNYFFGTMMQLMAFDRYAGEASTSPPMSRSLSPSPSPSASPSPSLPPEEDVDISDVIAARDLLDRFILEQQGQPSQPSSSRSPSPSPVILPDYAWTMTVQADPRAKTWCYEVWNETQGRMVEKRNAEGKPIMQEYFDVSGNRLTLAYGTPVNTYKILTDADGSVDYYRLYNLIGDRRQKLYVAKGDVQKPY